MNKKVLITSAIERLNDSILALQSELEKAVDAATNEETIPDGKYDTLALEASYLVHGQTVRLGEMRSDVTTLESLPLRMFSNDEAVALSAIVEVIDEHDNHKTYFLVPCAGGLTVMNDETLITLVTPYSPMGKALLTRHCDEEFSLEIGGKVCQYDIVSIS
jgi:transcription elongation GreA/GreB family factor